MSDPLFPPSSDVRHSSARPIRPAAQAPEQWPAAGTQPDEFLHQRQRLAQGLLRLEQTAAGSPSAPSGAPASRPIALPRNAASAGLALSQLLTRSAAQQRQWERAQLTEAVQRVRHGDLMPERDAFFYTDTAIMNLISHAIEERVIADHIAAEVYAGFQRFSLIKPQLPRYRALLEVARYICIYGLNDAAFPSEVAALRHPRLIRLPIDPSLQSHLEWFWFVVVDAGPFQTALLAQQIGGNLWSKAQPERTYNGLWTFNAALIQEIIAILQRAGRVFFAQADPR